MRKVTFRPLTEILEVIQKSGFDISYAYDDLLFSEHNVFIIRFDKETENCFWLHFNEDCEPTKKTEITASLERNSRNKNITLVDGGTYNIRQKEGEEEIELHFQ